jgi:hypothetical protein
MLKIGIPATTKRLNKALGRLNKRLAISTSEYPKEWAIKSIKWPEHVREKK